MRKNIHPTWYPETQITCTCGSSFTVGSTRKELRVEICSRCHPFFTGEMKFTTAKSKVEKFEESRAKAKKLAATVAAKKAKKKSSSDDPKSLKEMLLGLQ